MPDDDLVLDRLIHEPARLAILTVLSSVKDADFTFLQRATGLTKGNLSSHLTKLEAAGLVEVTKAFAGKRPTTSLALTPSGAERVARHWDQLDRLRELGATTALDAAAPSSPRPAGGARGGTPAPARSRGQ